MAALKELQRANAWDDSALARAVKRTPQQVYSWYSGQRRIGEKLARALEVHLGLPARWLDIPPAGDVALAPAPPIRGASLQAFGIGKTDARQLPALDWAQLATMLPIENSSPELPAASLSSFAPCSSSAKFVAMPDDSMAPTIAAGDHLLLDPVEAPRAGDVVLVRIPSGEHFVRVFRPRTAFAFEAAPVNEHYQALRSDIDGAAVAAVLVEHRRYRRPA